MIIEKIKTRKNDATNTTGESITARVILHRKDKYSRTCQNTVGYRYELNTCENHAYSARVLLKKLFLDNYAWELEEMPIDKHPSRGYAFSASGTSNQ
jgi:hypothetical protein